ncbi:MAG: hypothetical protein IPP16_09460 [Acidimicrobiaceae bacterium]|nr:hypothetical protein [Acidimicrobiaceae bacterium]
MTYRWIDSSDEVAGYVERVLAEPRYALDTEFHRERTYFPKLALVQIAAAGEIVLIDPLACDLSPLKRLFAGDGLAVLHAAQQDLDVLTHARAPCPSSCSTRNWRPGSSATARPRWCRCCRANCVSRQGRVTASPTGCAGHSAPISATTRRVTWHTCCSCRTRSMPSSPPKGAPSGWPTRARSCARGRSAAPSPTSHGPG